MGKFRQSDRYQILPSQESSLSGELQIAFMPIKPVYANRIIDGSKKFEFRRASIKKKLTHIIIYASSPVKKIIGIAEVDGIDVSCPIETWENTRHAAGISKEAFLEYFHGKEKAVTIKLKDILQLEREICPKEIEDGFKVPQSFKYVHADFLHDVFAKGRSLAL